MGQDPREEKKPGSPHEGQFRGKGRKGTMGGGKELEGSGGVQGGAELPHAGTAGPGSERGRMDLSPTSAQ